MSIDWGSYNGHLRVGIDHTVSPSNPSHSDTTVDVTWKFYLGTDGWNFSGDTSTLHESADGWGGTNTTFTNNLTSGDMLVDTKKITYSINYTNSGTKSASANLTGAYNGASPSKTSSVNLPERPIAAPSAGEAPAASSITSDGATITWDVPNDDGGDSVDNYEVQISTGSGFSSPVVDHTMGNTTRSYTTTALNSNTGYYVRVRAHNSAGWGDWTGSTFCHFTTLAGLPGVPGTPAKTSSTQTSITVGWQAANSNGGGTITYTLDRATNSTFTTGLTTVTTTATSYTATGLTANTTYYFRVKSTNTLGTSAESGTLTAKTNPSLTYNDTGDYVTLVNNLASAVADKLVHLGIYMWRGKTGATSVQSTPVQAISMGTLIGSRGPDAPTYSGNLTNNADFIIQYPGVYEIEFFYRWDENVPTGTHRFEEHIYINGNDTPSTTVNGGAVFTHTPTDQSSGTPVRGGTITRRLNVGDTVGWGLWQNTGVSNVPPSPVTDLYTWAKVTLVGF